MSAEEFDSHFSDSALTEPSIPFIPPYPSSSFSVTLSPANYSFAPIVVLGYADISCTGIRTLLGFHSNDSIVIQSTASLQWTKQSIPFFRPSASVESSSDEITVTNYAYASKSNEAIVSIISINRSIDDSITWLVGSSLMNALLSSPSAKGNPSYYQQLIILSAIHCHRNSHTSRILPANKVSISTLNHQQSLIENGDKKSSTIDFDDSLIVFDPFLVHLSSIIQLYQIKTTFLLIRGHKLNGTIKDASESAEESKILLHQLIHQLSRYHRSDASFHHWLDHLKMNYNRRLKEYLPTDSFRERYSKTTNSLYG